jgi:cysteine-rich repeat protein
MRNMRTPLLAGLLAVLLPACTDGITDLGNGGDDTGAGATCGNGAVDSGEECDDGNTTAGDGCSASCGMESASPRVSGSVDKMTVTTELAKTETVTVTLRSLGGFAGDVALTATLVDTTDMPIANVTVTGPQSVTLAANGMQTAAYDIKVPMNATGAVLTGTLKVAGTSSAGDVSINSGVTINNIYTIDYPTGTGTATNTHVNIATTPNLVVKRGAILRFHNSDTIDHIIHANSPYPHEDQNVMASGDPGRNYDIQTVGVAPGTAATIGCHSHPNPVNNVNQTYATYTVQ